MSYHVIEICHRMSYKYLIVCKALSYRSVPHSPDPAVESGRLAQNCRHVAGVGQDELRLAVLWPGLERMGGVGAGWRVVDVLDLKRSPATHQRNH